MASRRRRAEAPDRRRPSPRALAGTGLAAAAVLTGLNVGLLVVNRDTPSPGLSGPLEALTGLAYLGVAGVGAALLWRRANRAGWFFLVPGLLLAWSGFASEYGTYGILNDPGSLPAADYVTWTGAWGWWAGAGLLTFGLLLYPDGSLPAPRWRRPAAAAAAGIAVLVLLHAFAPGPLYGEYSLADNPLGAGESLLRSLREVGWVLFSASAALAVAGLLSRARTAGPDRRRQLQWLSLPGIVGIVAAPLWGLGSGGRGDPSRASQVLVMLALLGTAVAVAAALGRAARLTRSLERVVLAREEERGRIRRDLHDGLGPTLAGVALQLDVAKGLVRDDPARAETVLDNLVHLVKAGIGDVRRLIDDLRPPGLEQLGLVDAIREGTSYLTGGAATPGLAVVVEAPGSLGRLPPATEVTAFRIVMEAVTNASRHARASSCTVRLELDDALRVRVEDDGCGLAPDHVPGVGLASMCQRASELGGTCTVEARPGGGTLVLASLPVDE